MPRHPARALMLGDVHFGKELMTMAVKTKEYRFPVDIRWINDRRTCARIDGKDSLRIAPPPEFRGTDPGLWSPEDALVTAASSCLAVTITGEVQRQQLRMHDLRVHADGIVGHRPDGRFGFVRIEQTVELETEPGSEEAARSVVEAAEARCLVAVSLDLPVHTQIVVRATEAPAEAA